MALQSKLSSWPFFRKAQNRTKHSSTSPSRAWPHSQLWTLLVGKKEQPIHPFLWSTAERQHKSIFAVYPTKSGTVIAKVLAYFMIGFVIRLGRASWGLWLLKSPPSKFSRSHLPELWDTEVKWFGQHPITNHLRSWEANYGLLTHKLTLWSVKYHL